MRYGISHHNYFILVLSHSSHVPDLLAVEGNDEFQALIEEFQATDDSARVQKIFDELLNFDNDKVKVFLEEEPGIEIVDRKSVV